MEATTADLISALASLIAAGAAIYALYYAHRGVRLWEDEMLGRDSYELSKQMLVSASELLIAGDDLGNLELSAKHGPTLAEIQNRLKVLEIRVENQIFEAGAIWGNDWPKGPMIDLHAALISLTNMANKGETQIELTDGIGEQIREAREELNDVLALHLRRKPVAVAT